MLNNKSNDRLVMLDANMLSWQNILQMLQDWQIETENQCSKANAIIDLLEIPAKRLQLSPISLQANLTTSARESLSTGAEALICDF